MKRALVCVVPALLLSASASRADPPAGIVDGPASRESAIAGIEREQERPLAFMRARVFVFATGAYVGALPSATFNDVQGFSNLSSFPDTTVSYSGPAFGGGAGLRFVLGSLPAQARVFVGGASGSVNQDVQGQCQTSATPATFEPCTVKLRASGKMDILVLGDATVRSRFGPASPLFFGGGLAAGVLLASYHFESGSQSSASSARTKLLPLVGVVGEIGLLLGDGPGGLELPVRVMVGPTGGGAMLSPAWAF